MQILLGQTKCQIIKRTLQHNSKNNASHVLIHSKATKHHRVSMENVKILGRRYKSYFKRRISESLFIKQLKPDLNKQKYAFKLKLYDYTFFLYKQLLYKQPGLGSQKAKQLLRLTLPT